MWGLRLVLWLWQASLVLSTHMHIPRMPCDSSTRILNDCNWCRCVDGEFDCMTRDCRMVDKFAHFNEAIQPIKVGMEGHGHWRQGSPEMEDPETTTPTTTTTFIPVTESTCNPSVHYARDDLICVCTKRGTWPHRKCRAIFDKLVPVQSNELESFDDPCKPGLVYLVQCHICNCNKAGQVYQPYCTKMDCKKMTPAVLESEEAVRSKKGNDEREVYAECTEDVTYKLGCNTCICQRNNRLICDKCDEEKVNRAHDKSDSVCNNVSPGVVFNVGCNSCFCDKAGYTVCTMRLCLNQVAGTLLKAPIPQIARSQQTWVDAPADDGDCVPNTFYKRQCNICQCILVKGLKMAVCTKMLCTSPGRSQPDTTDLIESIKNDCVEGSVYEADCRTCRCTVLEGVKRESCEQKSVCDREAVKARRPGVLNALHGYCEPLHVYKKDCNTCECLADGKTVRCTSRFCSEQPKLETINVEILPISSPSGLKCPKARNSFMVDCNYCYCLPNGNALCTSKQCKRSF